MSLIYKKEDQITKSANELQELIQGEPCPKISFEELLYDFIDKHPGIGINEIQTEFSKYGNSLWIMDVLEDEKKICYLNGTYSRLGLGNNSVNGWHTQNYLSLVKIRKQLDENKLEDWQIEQEKKLNTYNGQVLSSTSEERELYFESYEDNSFYNEARGD